MKYLMLLMFLIFLIGPGCSKNENKTPVIKENMIDTVNANAVISTVKDTTAGNPVTDIEVSSRTDTVEKLPKLKPVEFTVRESIADLWKEYNSLKQEAIEYKENWNYSKLRVCLYKTAELAQKLERPDIASWQFNNLGFYSIVEFKIQTDYENRMNDLAIMPDGDDKNMLIEETKLVIEEKMSLLDSAMENLYDAMELDNQAPDKDRQIAISNNIAFIKNIQNYIAN